MTILPPPRPAPRHECDLPIKYHLSESTDSPMLPRWYPDTSRPAYKGDTLWECPDCGRWWKYGVRLYSTAADPMDWVPVRWYDIPARRRIAAHETAKMHYRVPNIVGDLHWWDCHPNPNRGRS